MTDIHVQRNFEALLAGLTCSRNRLMEMHYTFRPEDVPANLPFHRAWLDVLWTIQQTGGIPTWDNVALGLNMKYPNFKDAEQQIQEVCNYWGIGGDIASPSYFLWEWMDQQRVSVGINEALKIFNSGIGSIDERFRQAVDHINRSHMERSKSRPVGSIERFDNYIDVLRKRRDMMLEGKQLGAILPVSGLRNLAPILLPGELLVYSGPSGAGKSTIAVAQAEMNAWGDLLAHHPDPDVKGGVPVLLIHLETSHNSLQERQLARHLCIPTKFSKTSGFDPDSPEWRPILDKFRNDLLTFETQLAPIIYYHAPGASNHELESAIYLFSESCRANGQVGEVIVDYAQKMQSHNNLSSQENIAHNIEFLKSSAEIYQTHITTFSQENDDGKTYGSKQVIHKAQLWIQIQRYKAEQSMVRLGVKDAMNQPRMWHKENHWHAETTFNIEKANDDEPGSAKAWIEGAMYLIEDGHFVEGD